MQLGESYEEAFLTSRVEAALAAGTRPFEADDKLNTRLKAPPTPLTAAYHSENRDILAIDSHHMVSPESMSAEERRMEAAQIAAQQVKESMRILEEERQNRRLQEEAATGASVSPTEAGKGSGLVEGVPVPARQAAAAGEECSVCSACSVQ